MTKQLNIDLTETELDLLDSKYATTTTAAAAAALSSGKINQRGVSKKTKNAGAVSETVIHRIHFGNFARDYKRLGKTLYDR